MYGTEVLRTEPDGGDFTTQMDFAGRAVLSENPYGETTSWAYEGSQLKAVAYGFGGTDLAMEKYGDDTAGRMEWRWGPEAAATMSSSSPAAGNYAYWYAYSDAGRLLSREGPNDLTEWEWTDGVKTAEVVSGVSTTTYTYAPDAPRVLEKLVGAQDVRPRVTPLCIAPSAKRAMFLSWAARGARRGLDAERHGAAGGRRRAS